MMIDANEAVKEGFAKINQATGSPFLFAGLTPCKGSGMP